MARQALQVRNLVLSFFAMTTTAILNFRTAVSNKACEAAFLCCCGFSVWSSRSFYYFFKMKQPVPITICSVSCSVNTLIVNNVRKCTMFLGILTPLTESKVAGGPLAPRVRVSLVANKIHCLWVHQLKKKHEGFPCLAFVQAMNF